MSVHWPILRRLISRPGRALVTDDQRTYRGLDLVVMAWHLATALRARCQSPTAGVLLPTSGLFPAAALGGWWAGKTVVPLNYLLKQEELQYVIDDCGTDTILTVRPMLEFLGYRPRVRHLVLLEDLNFRSVPEPSWPAGADDGDLALLLYTSGTSGRPKGVMLTHGNIAANIRQIADWVSFTPADTLLGVLPQFHSFGLTVLTLLPLAAGCKVVYTARFVPQKMVRLLRAHRPTVLIAIPSMYNALLSVKDAAPADYASLRYIVSGGEPLPQAVLEGFFTRFGVRINEGYGLTETAPVSNWCRPHEFRPRSVGRPLPGVAERIVDVASERDLPPGADGEVRIAGPHVMRGYYKLPEQTAAAFDGRGFFRTGDIGRMDLDGHLYITGRLKEMMIVGGENVFPREIEEVLERHPAVRAAGVIGISDPVRGEEPVAFVEAQEGAAPEPRELQAWCRRHLA
ncbi:MAG TPA: AMP-binding protein, partial [Phycisphaerales bacterium]|nr:AMP-binding protein [Phycisphaerales bacterium]